MMNSKPHVVILGGNFAGLGSAQKIREFAGEAVDITVVDRKPYLLYVPNIPGEVFEGRNPGLSMTMDIVKPLDDDRIRFVQAEALDIDPDNKQVDCRPTERPGGAPFKLEYDYLVIAIGNRLAFDRIEGYAEHGHGPVEERGPGIASAKGVVEHVVEPEMTMVNRLDSMVTTGISELRKACFMITTRSDKPLARAVRT